MAQQSARGYGHNTTRTGEGRYPSHHTRSRVCRFYKWQRTPRSPRVAVRFSRNHLPDSRNLRDHSANILQLQWDNLVPQSAPHQGRQGAKPLGRFFEGYWESRHIHAAMPNLVSISFHCEGPCAFGLLTPTDPSSPPFPHLELIMVFGSESGLRGNGKDEKRPWCTA